MVNKKPSSNLSSNKWEGCLPQPICRALYRSVGIKPPVSCNRTKCNFIDTLIYSITPASAEFLSNLFGILVDKNDNVLYDIKDMQICPELRVPIIKACTIRSCRFWNATMNKNCLVIVPWLQYDRTKLSLKTLSALCGLPPNKIEHILESSLQKLTQRKISLSELRTKINKTAPEQNIIDTVLEKYLEAASTTLPDFDNRLTNIFYKLKEETC